MFAISSVWAFTFQRVDSCSDFWHMKKWTIWYASISTISINLNTYYISMCVPWIVLGLWLMLVDGSRVFLPSGNQWLFWSNPHNLDIYADGHFPRQTLIQQFKQPLHEILGVFLKYWNLLCWQGGAGAERGGSAIQIEVPAGVVSHVSKIGLNWSKWANLGGKETRGLNFRDFWAPALPSTNKSRRESHCKCARVCLNKFEHSTVSASLSILQSEQVWWAMYYIVQVWVWHTANSRSIISVSAISGRC